MGSKQRKKGQARGAAVEQGSVTPAKSIPKKLPNFRYKHVAALLVMVAALYGLYAEVLVGGKVLSSGDATAATSTAVVAEVAKEDGAFYPFWNPYQFGGMPTYETLTYVPHVYPLGYLTKVLVSVFRFPQYTWLFLHVWLLGVGVYLLLREYDVHYLIAMGAGVLMMWMPNYVAIGAHGHGSKAVAVALMPFALLFWDRIWRGKGVALNASLLVFCVATQLLRAHLQISYYTLALLGLHFIFFSSLQVYDVWRSRDGTSVRPHFRWPARAITQPAASRRALGLDLGGITVVFVLVLVFSLLISSVLFLPVQDYAQFSTRGGSAEGGLEYEYATSWSLSPLETITFIVPFAYGFGKHTYFGHMPFTDYPNYVGLVIAIFAVFAVVLVRTRFVRFLAFIILLTTLVAMGKNFPVIYASLFKWLPYFNKFRVPVMVLIVQQLAFVVLFGLGVSALMKVDHVVWRKRTAVCLIASVVLVLLAFLTRDYWTGTFATGIASRIRGVRNASDQIAMARQAGAWLHADLVKQAIIGMLVFGFMWLYLRRVLSPILFVGLVLILAATDLYLIDRHILHPEKHYGVEQYRIVKTPVDDTKYKNADDLVRFLKRDESIYRVFPMFHPSAPLRGDFTSNRYMNFRISSIGGYHAAKLSVYENFVKAMGASMQRGDFRPINMLNVKYVIAGNPFPENPVFKPVWEGVDYRGDRQIVYENRDVLPRAYFMDNYRLASSDEALQIVAGGFDPSQTVLLESEPAISPVSAVGATAEVTTYKLNEITLRASLDSAALLVVSEVYYPKWKAYVDGVPTEIMRANYVLRALALDAGDHEIVFRYDSSLIRRSLFVSIGAAAIALLVLIVSLIRKVRGPGSGSTHRDPDIQRA